jgi:Domain of unknown function (DUF4192)
MTADITLRGPGDVLAALPYQLGYHPTESVVLVALHAGRVGLVARCDLPPDDSVDATVPVLVEPVVRERTDAVVLVGYEREPGSSHPLLLALVEDLERRQVHVLGVDVVRGGRRYSPTCSESCCPPEGVPLPDPADVPAVAELVALGRAPLASREAVEGLVEAAVGAGTVGELLARRQRAARGDVAVRAWARVLAPPGERRTGRAAPLPWTPRIVADAASALAVVALRDALVGWLAPGVLPRAVLDPAVVARLERSVPRWAGMGRWGAAGRSGPERQLLLERLLLLCRSVPDDAPAAAAAVCTVAAHVAWADGEGAVAHAALDRALRLEPGYRLARLLAGLVEHGLRMSPAIPHGDDVAPRAG